MALIVDRAILHILSNTGAASTYSREELDIDSETCYEFIAKHVRRLMNSAGAKEAVFSAESQVYQMVKSYQTGDLHFKQFSLLLCERLATVMAQSKDIPSADVLVTAFQNGQDRYIALLKLNYTECFTHKVVEDEHGSDNQIIKNTLVLPFTSGRVEEACLIPYDPMILRIVEKSYPINGEETNYFSQLFLECETQLSQKESADIIHEIAQDINAKYFDEDVEMAAKVKCAFIAEAEETDLEDAIVLENVVRRVFPEHAEAKAEFIAKAQDAGLPHEVRMDKPFIRQQFKVQRFKADNGIELKLPAELFNDPETVQFTTNTDGTVSITLKNLRKC